MSKQQQQQPEMAPPQQTCTRCGGIGFFYTPIMDSKTSRTVHLFRCKICENQQWTSGEESG